MKEDYVRVEVETIRFEDLDIITQSTEGWEEDELHELD